MTLATDFSKLSKQELCALLEQQHANTAAGLMVKVTEKGGIFIRHDSFIAVSSAGKTYVQGLNMSYDTAMALFNNQVLLDNIKKSINAIQA